MPILPLTEANFEQEVLQAEGPVLVDLFAPWCGPCRALAPVLETLAEARPELRIGKVDVDAQPELAARFDVLTVPTLLAGVGLYGALTGTDVFSALTAGALDGLRTVVRIFPALVALLAALPLADCPSTQAIRALHALFPHGDYRGTALGIAQADDLSGPLTLAFTMLTLNDTGCTGRFDSRTPLTATQASVQTVAEAALRAAGFAVQGDMDPPHYVPESDPFLRTLAQCYEAYTGQKGQCLAIGGGTYVHDIPGGVAFGPNMPGFVSNLHGPDEKIRVADLLTTAKIYAQVMVALCL